MNIGEKIKEARMKRQMTLEQLSQKSGISVGLLSQVERGISSPNINRLQQITEALGINVVLLVDDAEINTESNISNNSTFNFSNRISVVRKDKRKKILMSDGSYWELLAPVWGRKIGFLMICYPAKTKVEEPYRHEGEECAIILEGKFKGTIGDKEIVLEKGDSISFDSSIPHRWENIGDSDAIAIWVLSPPSL